MNAPLNSRSLTPPETPELQRGNPGYAPSAVPMVVHRQVISELEGAKHHIQVLTQDNQRLQQQNQDLRVEIDRVVKAVRRLQGLAEHLPHQAEANPSPEMPGDYPDPLVPYRLPPDTQRPPLYTEISESAPYPESSATRLQREGGGWWLILTVLLIVVTAFGTGFLIVRPFLNNSSSQ